MYDKILLIKFLMRKMDSTIKIWCNSAEICKLSINGKTKNNKVVADIKNVFDSCKSRLKSMKKMH